MKVCFLIKFCLAKLKCEEALFRTEKKDRVLCARLSMTTAKHVRRTYVCTTWASAGTKLVPLELGSCNCFPLALHISPTTDSLPLSLSPAPCDVHNSTQEFPHSHLWNIWLHQAPSPNMDAASLHRSPNRQECNQKNVHHFKNENLVRFGANVHNAHIFELIKLIDAKSNRGGHHASNTYKYSLQYFSYPLCWIWIELVGIERDVFIPLEHFDFDEPTFRWIQVCIWKLTFGQCRATQRHSIHFHLI